MQSYVQRAKKQSSSPDIVQAVRSSDRPRAIPEPVREKMGASFGMDFSSVKIYESPLVGQQGAEAAAMGNEIAFAPGKFNMGSFSGQALLGHELAHIGQQARGEVSGGGVIENSAFERQADVQGVMAARGEPALSSAFTPMGSGLLGDAAAAESGPAACLSPVSAGLSGGAGIQLSRDESVSQKDQKKIARANDNYRISNPYSENQSPFNSRNIGGKAGKKYSKMSEKEAVRSGMTAANVLNDAYGMDSAYGSKDYLDRKKRRDFINLHRQGGVAEQVIADFG